MAVRRGYHRGGIRGLLAFLDEHLEAIEYDLLDRGLSIEHLGSRRLSWTQFRAYVHKAPRTSALGRDVLGADTAQWGLTQHLLAGMVDALNAANWQRAGKKAGPKPRPIKRPGATNEKRVGSKPIPISEFNTWWHSHDKK